MKKTLPLFFFSILIAAATFAGTVSVRYLSNDGDDAADGLTPETAWRSLAKLSRSLPAGGEARLRCGDVFYGRARLKSGRSAERRTTLTSYGEGPAPEIHAYKTALPDPTVWEPTGTNHLWRIDLSDHAKFDGNHDTPDDNVGFLKVDGQIHGRKFFGDPAKLTRQWDFIDDHRTVTVWSERNPALVAKSIRFAPKMGILPFASHVTFSNIVVRGTGGHAANVIGIDLRFFDCGFHEIGGSHLGKPGAGTTRFGNGIECWAGSSDILVERCSFSEIYDTAFTLQGPSPKRSWENTHVVDSVFTNCTQCTELWATKCAPGIGIKNCSFRRNRCVNTGRGWAWESRPAKSNAVPLLMYAMETDVCDYLVTENVFINSRKFLVCKSGGVADLPASYRIEGNTIIGPTNQPLAYCRGKGREKEERARIEQLRAQNTFKEHE